MMTQNTSDWAPPTLETMNLTRNCELAAEVLAHGWPLPGNVPIDLALSYMNSTIPENGRVGAPSAGQLAMWYLDVFVHSRPGSMFGDNVSMADALIYAVSDDDACSKYFCRAFDFKGYPDLAGPGMVITLLLEAAIVTVYCVLLSGQAAGFFWCGARDKSRLQHAVEETAVTFTDVATLFALSVLVASLYTYVLLMENSIPYFTQEQVSVTTSSALSAWTMQVLLGVNVRRFQWRSACVLVLTTLWAAGHAVLWSNLWGRGSSSDEPSVNMSLFWNAFCVGTVDEASSYLKYPTVFIFWFALPLVLGAVGFALSVVLSRRRAPPKIGQAAPVFRGVSVIFLVILLWQNLQLYLHKRNHASNNSGNSNEEVQWTFGQLLALATWIPTFIEFSHILFFGAEEGLSGKLSNRYKAIDVAAIISKTEDSIEDASLSEDGL